MSNDVVNMALNYASRGWPVLPVNGKRPAIKGGVYGASTDAEFIRTRFSKKPNIGIQTGQSSGLVVVDIDPRNGGDSTFSELVAIHGAPSTLEAITGGGGFHLFFNHPGVRLKGKLGAGIDIKADGGFVVAPPSIHPDTHNPYKWRNDSPIADMPAWMVERLTQAPTAREIDSHIPVGERNKSLLLLGHQFKKEGKNVEISLLEANRIRCVPPLTDEEVHSIVEKVNAFKSAQSFKTRWQQGVLMDATLSMYQRGVLMCLSLYMDENGGNCYPAMETLEIRFHLSRDSLSKAIEAGIDRGWLERYRRPKPKHAPGKQKWSYGYVAKIPFDVRETDNKGF